MTSVGPSPKRRKQATPPPRRNPVTPSPRRNPVTPSTRRKQATPSPRLAPTRLLRAIPKEDRLSRTDLQVDSLWDKNSDGIKRKLPDNETLVLQLNEIAAEHARGFFLHLPSREAWRTNPKEERRPKSRNPSVPGPQYPPLVFMNFAWSSRGKDSFFDDTHRARYLKCSALINPPSPQTPLFPIQLASSAASPVYIASAPSLVIYNTAVGFYLLDTSEGERLVGRSSTTLAAKLGTFPDLWESAAPIGVDGSVDKAALMGPFYACNVSELYAAILRRCDSRGDIESSLTAGELARIIPRPSSPEAGMPLGCAVSLSLRPRSSFSDTTVTQSVSLLSSEPPTRRGKTRQTKGKRVQIDHDEDEDDGGDSNDDGELQAG